MKRGEESGCWKGGKDMAQLSAAQISEAAATAATASGYQFHFVAHTQPLLEPGQVVVASWLVTVVVSKNGQKFIGTTIVKTTSGSYYAEPVIENLVPYRV
jgi:hypothetical protein